MSAKVLNVVSIVACQSSQALVVVGVGLFLPLIRSDLDLTYSQAGMFALVATATYALMQVPAGYLSDRVGAKKIFAIGTVGVNVMTFAFAVLPTFGGLLLSQGVSGIFRAMMFAPGMVLMTRQFAPDRRATAMGLFIALSFSSNIALNLFGPYWVEALGWQRLFLYFAVYGAGSLLTFMWLVPSEDASANSGGMSVRQVASVMKHRVVLLCGGIQFVRLAVTMSVLAWWPTYLVVEKGLSLVVAGTILAVGWALTAPANLVGGFISDKTGRPTSVISVALVCIASSLVAITQTRSVASLLVLVAVNQFFLQVYFGPLFEIPLRVLGTKKSASLSGVSNMFANLGALTAIYILGLAKDSLGSFDGGVFVLAGLCLVALVFTRFLAADPALSSEHPS